MAIESFDRTAIRDTSLMNSVLDASTEYSIIGTDFEGTILLWNEGAQAIYGYEPGEIIGLVNSEVLHTPEDLAIGRPRRIMDEALHDGKWEGTLEQARKNGERFTARVVLTPRRDQAGSPVGFLLISKDISDESELADELRAAQFYTRSLIESHIDALITTDPLGVITEVNRRMCELTGHDRESLIGSPFRRYCTDPVRAEDGIRRVLAEERVTNFELVMRSKDGHETVVSYDAAVLRDAEGRLKGVFAAVREITAQKQLEEDLRQVQSYTRGLIEASVDALLVVDAQFQITDVNEQTLRITGYSRDELIGSHFPDYFTNPELATAGVRRTLDEGFVKNYVLVLRAKSGAEGLVSFNASVFKDPDGVVRGVFISARDIAEQIRLEEELRLAQNYTRGLIEASVDPMVTVDQDLVISDVNEQMVKLTEVPKESLVGSRFDSYFTDPANAAAGVRRTLHEGTVTNYELTLETRSGRQVLVSFNASIFRDPEGNVKGMFAVVRDVTDHRSLEEQLRETENYSRGHIEASVDALVTINPDRIITDVNEQMVRLTGCNRQQLIGSPFSGYFTDPVRAEAGAREAFEQGAVTNYELVVRSRLGNEAAVSFNAAVFRDIGGAVAGIFASARDVADQKGLEQALREQTAYTRGLIESNIDALTTTDTLGNITDVNRQMCAATGREREELIGTPFKDYFTDTMRAEDAVRQVLAEGRVTNYELTIRAADGKETLVSYNATTFTGAEGRLKGVFAAARDITDQKGLEHQLREQQAYSRGLIESSVDAMLTVDPDLTITDVNEQMARLTGYSREELIGSSFTGYFTDPELARAVVRQTLDEGSVTNYELILRSRHRRRILVSFNASIFRDPEGNVRGIFAVARDVTEGRRLEEQLRESENYNRGLIESYVDALVMVDPDGLVTNVNEQMIQMTGYTRDDLVGSPFRDYFTQPDLAIAGVRETLARGTVTNYELTLQSRTGRRTLVSFNAGTFKDTDGRVAGILAAARDITEQKRLEQELGEQQAYNRSVIESSVDALMTVDPDGVITDVNEQAVRLVGFNRKQLIGSPFVGYFADPDLAQVGVRLTLEQEAVNNYELIVRTRTGRKIPVSFNAAAFRDTSGTVDGILAVLRDSTEQQRIEGELREQQTYTRGLIESNIDALMTTDSLGIITDVNRQMCAVTGREREELIGTRFKAYFTDPQHAEDAIREVLAEGRVTNYELMIRAADGKETLVSFNATTFAGADGRLKGVFAAARDITAQKRLEEQIREQNRELVEKNGELEEQYRRVQEANRLKSEFLANMSHELRTPLNGIIGFAQLMHDEKVGPVSADHKEYLGDILTSSSHLLQLINDVLDLAKVESGKMDFNPEPVDMGKIVTEVRDILRTLAASKQIQVDVRVDEEVRSVVADSARLKQILYNYLSNAIKFTPSDGRVTIRVLPEGADAYRIEVQDTGIGIALDEQHRLFIEFQQLDASSAKKYQGTGLGLALTKRMAEAQGGRVGVRSEQGAGSTFFAVLPRIMRPLDDGQEPPVFPDLDTNGTGPAILVIDDNATDRAWLARVLDGAGYRVTVAADGAAAAAECRAQTFDAITLDLLLPDVHGSAVLREIRTSALNHDTPVVVVTVIAQSDIGLGFAIQDCLTKPIEAGQLLAALRRTGADVSQSETVLVVDDDASIRRFLGVTLKAAGFEPVCLPDGESGLQFVGKTPPGAIILDLMMEGMDGFEFLYRLRRTTIGRRIPVVVLTSKDLNQVDRQRLQASAQAVVLKGAGGADALLTELQAWLREASSSGPAGADPASTARRRVARKAS